jgi:hypothetical protein
MQEVGVERGEWTCCLIRFDAGKDWLGACRICLGLSLGRLGRFVESEG